MKVLPSGMQAHLDTGATTLAWCWRLTRSDGVVFGFTDHDRNLSFDGTTFEAATGFTASEIRETVGLNVDNLDVEGALRSDRLNENDLAAALYDDAAIEIYRVNWAAVSQRVLMRKGSIGEVRRGPHGFVAEMRGLAHYLNQEKGRIFQYGCDADLGDSRCAVNLTLPAFKGSGLVTSVANARTFVASGLAAFADDVFARGLLTWTSGPNTGHTMEVKAHYKGIGGADTIELWRRMSEDVGTGNAFTITAGCNKQFETCRTKFANGNNFRGFPHMPGNDYVTAYPNSGDSGNDGGSRFS